MGKDLSKSPLLRAFINAFIILHIFIMAVWGLPGSKFRNTLVRPIEDYVIWPGIWHSWAMFSPDPLSINFNVEAEITFEDGTSTTWVFPRMEELGIWERFRKERFRKWRERVRQDSYRVLWEDTSRYIARLHNNPTNPPVGVVLVREWAQIPPPVKGDFQPIPEKYALTNQYRFSYYTVKKEDL